MIYGVLIIIVSSLISLILTVSRSSGKDIYKKTFIYSKLISISGIIGATATTIAAIGSLLQGDWEEVQWGARVFLISVCVLIHLSSCYLILLGFNWKIELFDEGLIYTNWLRKKKYIPYSHIIEIKTFTKNSEIEKYKIYCKENTITVDYLVKDFNCFYKTLKKMIKKSQKRDCIQ